MSYDLLIKNGTVVDGSGAPRYRADIAVANGKIAEIGKITDSAKQMLDASDLIVAPGFVDPHTHYDAQICWDPLITSSSWHGVTSLVMGNCGVGIAPCKPEVHEIAAWDLVNVEAIPFDVLAKGIKWEWGTPWVYGAADALPALRDGRGVNGAGGHAARDRANQSADQRGGSGRGIWLYHNKRGATYRL